MEGGYTNMKMYDGPEVDVGNPLGSEIIEVSEDEVNIKTSSDNEITEDILHELQQELSKASRRINYLEENK